jgi:cytochrome b
MTEPVPQKTRVWDVPPRVVHWSMVLLFAFSWWSAEQGDLERHRWSGYAFLAVLLFRLFWGFVGGSTARFSQFVRGPRAVSYYLRGMWNGPAGHNPLGALSVVVMFLLLFLQVGLGLIAVDVDGIESGPLSHHVSFETGRSAAEWHEKIFNALLVVIGIHILAVLVYLARGQNLVGAMFTGKRALDGSPPGLVPAKGWLAVVGIALAVAITWFIAGD